MVYSCVSAIWFCVRANFYAQGDTCGQAIVQQVSVPAMGGAGDTDGTLAPGRSHKHDLAFGLPWMTVRIESDQGASDDGLLCIRHRAQSALASLNACEHRRSPATCSPGWRGLRGRGPPHRSKRRQQQRPRRSRLSIILARSQVADELPRMFPACPRGILACKGGCRGDDMVWGGFDRRCPGLFGFLRSARSTDCVARDRRRESRRLQAGPGARTAAPTSRESCVVGLLHRARRCLTPEQHCPVAARGGERGVPASTGPQAMKGRRQSPQRQCAHCSSGPVVHGCGIIIDGPPDEPVTPSTVREPSSASGRTACSMRPYGIPVRSRPCCSVALWWAVEDFLAQ